jgi:hypothetical protein
MAAVDDGTKCFNEAIDKQRHGGEQTTAIRQADE